eukprot:78891-Pelagomonas_calceolata.AAC.2
MYWWVVGRLQMRDLVLRRSKTNCEWVRAHAPTETGIGTLKSWCRGREKYWPRRVKLGAGNVHF